jgi:hypothetical protein
MAYLYIMSSVPRARVEKICVPDDVAQVASRIAHASHLIASASKELREAMDGGTPLNTDTWQLCWPAMK